MTRYGWRFGCWLLAGLPLAAGAQAPRAGDGLRGEYYDGHNFERYVLTRRDAVVDFDWHQQRPAAGLGAEDFSVRWTGWLVPPTTGHYVLHVSADDGIRLWLNGRELLDEWRGQPLSYYQLAVELRAGEAYALRIEYCQYSRSTRARLAWAPPPTPPAAGSWRNLWGLTEEEPAGSAVIPTRYLFSQRPTPPPSAQAAPPGAAPARLIPPVQLAPVRVSAPRQEAPTKAALLPQPPVTVLKPRPRSYLALVAPPPPVARPLPPPAAATDSNQVAAVGARLAAGRAVTLRALYFEQGRAELLPSVQASLDTLAAVLAGRPTLRLEVQGHTDNQGDPGINQQLSRRRAAAVCGYLESQGIGAGRLRPVGYGGTRPVADNRQPDQRPRNRRVVLRPLP